jgi:hypothetical protein
MQLKINNYSNRQGGYKIRYIALDRQLVFDRRCEQINADVNQDLSNKNDV